MADRQSGRENIRTKANASNGTGRRGQAHECTFCGASLAPGHTVCDECGMPVGGIVCPVCGTLNHRSFCCKCNAPLNRVAEAAVAEARNDPAFQQVSRLIEEAVKLKEKISGKYAEPSEGTLEFLKMFSSDVAFTGTAEPELQEEYLRTVRDIDALFTQMLPPAGSTPQQQFNYYSARNIAVTTVLQEEVRIKSPVGWICNYCGCRHSQPSECVQPFLGGTWVYEDKVVTERVVVKEIKAEE